MDAIPPELAQYADLAIAPAILVLVNRLVALVGMAALVPRKRLPLVALALGTLIGACLGALQFTTWAALLSSVVAGAIIGLSASGAREVTRR